MPTSEAARELGSNIRAEMGRQRVSMVELARRTGISRSTLYHQINIGTLSAPALVLVADALDLSIADLIGTPRTQEASA
jgi:transcriptional regulator with XRE-family HTH domain